MKFKSVKEAKEAAREVLAEEVDVVCIRYDEEQEATEVVCLTKRGSYWMVKFYSENEIAFGMMKWAEDMQWV